MTTNPSSGADEVREETAPAPVTEATADSQPASPETPSEPEKHPAAEVLPTPAGPTLSKEFSPESIVNLDYLEEDGDEMDLDDNQMLALINQYEETLTDIQEGQILSGTVIEVRENEVLLNIGFKSEGVIPLEEFGENEVKVGDTFDVFLEKLENQDGLVVLSKERADFLKVWDKIKTAHESGEVVTGTVDRRIKGGLVVKLWGVDTFLPGSQVALRQVPNLEDMIGEEIQCLIIKKNKRRRNVVVSRRIVLEQEREEKKRALIAELEKGQVRKGVVKNITDFGAFVDLGGIDGLLHITDMSWGRISHPSEMVAIDDEIEVMILNIDRERERISLGLKQKQPSPWEDVEVKYPVGSKVRGQVVNVMSYGAFVKLEEGVEGLVHISEMSWTRRVTHPSEVVAIGDMVDVVVLGINKDKQEISLGMKQTEVNPWTLVEEKYPKGTIIKGRVRNMTNYGAFIEIEEGIDGLLHVSDISWTKKVNHPSEVVKKNEKVETIVLSVDQEKKRVALGMKQLTPDPWLDRIPSTFVVGDMVKGKVTKVTNFGVFVELEEGLEGLLHVSELADRKVRTPEEVVQVGDEVEVRIIRVDPKERKIGLSMRDVAAEETAARQDEKPGAQAIPDSAKAAPLGQTILPRSDSAPEQAAEPQTDAPEAPEPAPVSPAEPHETEPEPLDSQADVGEEGDEEPDGQLA